MSMQNLFTIAPHAAFLTTLADRILDNTLTPDWDIGGPFGLADITVILPTRRARLALSEIFADRLGGAVLLPDIRTFGGAPEEEEPFLPPFEAPPLTPAIPPMRRRLMLAQLVEKWAQQSGDMQPGPAEILALADSLAELIDDCHVEGVAPNALRQIVAEDLPVHWQDALKFLDIAFAAWPTILTEAGLQDAASLRNQQLARQAGAADTIFGDKPVIAAGSTGSIPATANLLKTIAGLPRGALVLPGLDTSLSPAMAAHLADPAHAPHGHPQYGLVQLLDRFGVRPDQVTELAKEPAHPRTHFVRRSLALPDDVTDWAETAATLPYDAFDGLAISVARTDEEQARAIALAAHAALVESKSVGIISPDRTLARRIAAELARFDIGVDDSAGMPLSQSRMGRLARQLVVLVESRFAPVDLMAVLNNRYTSLGMGRALLSDVAQLLDLALLRGARPAPGLAGLRQHLDRNLAGEIDHVPHQLTTEEGARIRDLFDRLDAAIALLSAILAGGGFFAAQMADALTIALAALAAPEPGKPAIPIPGADEFASWIETLIAEPDRGPHFRATGFGDALERLMAGVTVRPPAAHRTDIAIWGQLEARLQNPDVLILAGLTEGVWPEAADPGPWASRTMRIRIGLEPPERRLGQAAHDFEMALGNRNVLVTLAERSGTSPATPSRLVQRLEALAGPVRAEAMRAQGKVWVERARALDLVPGPPKPAPRPTPAPPANARPRSLSITEVETLIRSPYDLYAKYVLGLRPLDPLGVDPGPRERGTLLHEIFGRFIEEGHDPTALDAPAQLARLADSVLTALEALPERQTLWQQRFAATADAFIAFERARPEITMRQAELSGAWHFEVEGTRFTLRGRADRIDIRQDGRIEIIDFKTGSVPEPREMTALLAPQLPLEAKMVAEGVFGDIAAAPTEALTYIKIGAGPAAFEVKPFAVGKDCDLATAIDQTFARFQAHLKAYCLSDTTAMTARIFPKPNQRFAGSYDHLARTGEWTIAADGDEAAE